MARSEGNSSGASQLPKSEAATITITPTRRKIPRRQLTLIIITVCLNVLLWSSIFSLIASLYFVGADPGDVTMLASQVQCAGPCVHILHYPPLRRIAKTEDMVRETTSEIAARENLLHSNPTCSNTLHTMASDLRLEFDHSGTPARVSP